MSAAVYIVEDHPLMRESYELLIEHTEGLCVCGSSETAETALDEIPRLKPDISLVDVALPKMSGLELVSTLIAQLPDLRMLVISAHEESRYGMSAMQAGARGFLEKGNTDELIKAIETVLAGEIYASKRLRRRLERQG